MNELMLTPSATEAMGIKTIVSVIHESSFIYVLVQHRRYLSDRDGSLQMDLLGDGEIGKQKVL